MLGEKDLIYFGSILFMCQEHMRTQEAIKKAEDIYKRIFNEETPVKDGEDEIILG